MVDLDKLYKYYIILFFEVNYKSTSFVSENKYDYNKIYDYINNFWYQNNGYKLDISKDEDKVKLYDFLDDIFRYNLLNDNLKLVYDTSTDNGKNEFLVNNFLKMTSIAQTIMLDIKDYTDVEIKDLTKITNVELDKLFSEFLLQIDSSKEMLKMYNCLKEESRFILLDILDEEEKNRIKQRFNINQDEYNDYFLLIEDSEGFIILDRKHNIQDLFTLIHEFIHFYVFNNNKDNRPNFLLQEFPSIVFETLMCNFLIEKGFDIEQIGKLSCYRLNHLNSMSHIVSAISYYMSLYLKNGSVSKELDIEQTNKKVMKLINTIGEDGYKKLKEENNIIDDLYKISKDYCNFTNYYLSVEPKIIKNGYAYVIGYYLATNYLNKFYKNEITLDEIVEITKNISKINIDELFNLSNNLIKKKEKK